MTARELNKAPIGARVQNSFNTELGTITAPPEGVSYMKHMSRIITWDDNAITTQHDNALGYASLIEEPTPAGSIDITPNYANLRTQFMREAALTADRAEGEALSAVRALLVSLDIAAQAIDSAAAVQEFRDALHTIAMRTVERDDKQQQEGYDQSHDYQEVK